MNGAIMRPQIAGMDHITIRCRNRINWIRVIILTVLSAMTSWLLFGLFCTLLEPILNYWQALITPLALIFLALGLVAFFIGNRRKYKDRP